MGHPVLFRKSYFTSVYHFVNTAFVSHSQELHHAVVLRHGVRGLLAVLLRRGRGQQEQLPHQGAVRRGLRGAGRQGRLSLAHGRYSS